MKSASYDKILHIARKHSEQFLSESSKTNFLSYHSFFHTSSVVQCAIKLGKLSLLDEDELSHIQLAAWFHDHGFAIDPKDHEFVSCDFLKQFLAQYDPNKVFDLEMMKRLILATRLEAEPQTLGEQIIKDADLHYIGTRDFERQAALLKKEWELVLNKTYDTRAWIENNIRFLSKHTFYTTAANELFQQTKEDNLEALQKQLTQLDLSA